MPPKKKKVSGLIKLQIQPKVLANPAPPVSPALGQHGVNIMEFCKAYNTATESQRGNDRFPWRSRSAKTRSLSIITERRSQQQKLIKKAADVPERLRCRPARRGRSAR